MHAEEKAYKLNSVI